jgi:hypothetical protein
MKHLDSANAGYCRLGQHPDNGPADLEGNQMDDEKLWNSSGVRAAADAGSSPDRGPTVGGALRQRSAVTNGTRLLTDGDNRGPWARRMRDVIELHVSDLGGWDVVSEAEKSILRRVAALTIELERLEAKFSIRPPTDTDLNMYQRCSNSMRRLLETVGIHRRPRDVTPPTLEHFLGSLKDPK